MNVMKKFCGNKPRTLTLASLFAGVLLVATAAGSAAVLYTCPGGGPTYGDWNTHGFYVTNYAGITLDTATLQVSAPSAYPGTYSLTLTARNGAFNGLSLGSATTTLALSGGPNNMISVVFTYPSVPITKGGTVAFILTVASGPYSQVYYNVGGGCGGVMETADTTPPLSSNYRLGVALTLTGTQGTVTPGWSIQAAINAASPGETVFVGPGTYHEDLSLRSGINVIGSGYGSTFLVGSGTTNAVTCLSITNCRLAGFSISGGGGAIYNAGVLMWGGSPMVDNNLIVGNTNGVWIVAGCCGIVRNNLIEYNCLGIGSADGGSVIDTCGISCDLACPLIANNLLVGNTNVGVRLGRPMPTPVQMINNTVVGSQLGLVVFNAGNPIIKNNIVAGNNSGISASSSEAPALSFNDAFNNLLGNYRGVAAGLGGISADPVFDPTQPGAYYLATTSPCIHAGDPDPAYNNPDGTRNTMGAYGGPASLQQNFASGLLSGFLFNTVGIIPTSEITQSGASAGLVNVSSNVASALHIEPFEDAPLGGWVYLYGLFGMNDSAVRYYQILAAPWSGGAPPALSNFNPVLDPLTKTEFIIATNGSVTPVQVSLGPDLNGLYLRTDLPSSGYWSLPDLKLILNTLRLQNGRWDFLYRAFATNSLASGLTLPSNSLSRITLWIDNNPVTTSISAVRDAAGNPVADCGMIYATIPQENLGFDITAYHPAGFLYNYWLSSSYGRNHSGGYVTFERYAGMHDSTRPLWYGAPAVTTTNVASAFGLGVLANWQTCAYQFHLEAWARTINGFGRIYGSSFDDHYYINVAGSGGPCLADLNNDGRVDGLDLAIFAARFGTNCTATPKVVQPDGKP